LGWLWFDGDRHYLLSWGKQSGAHINPVVTFTFWRLGKVKSWDAFFYIMQFFGRIGLLLVAKVLKRAIADPSVNYIVTVPGSSGVAFFAEVIISFGLMTIVLCTSNNQRLAQWTGVFAGILVAYILAPFSGMNEPALYRLFLLKSGQQCGSTASWECCWQQRFTCWGVKPKSSQVRQTKPSEQ